MKNEGWPAFSFTDLLRPALGWRTENAILSTYSADLSVVVAALLALTDCDLDLRRAGSRVELVKAIEALRGRVRILAQAGRVAIPNTPRPILKLLDKFLVMIDEDENKRSWHPKVVLVRYHRVDDPTDRQWRIWIGSRNLTRALNWEAGLVLTSRSDGQGAKISGLSDLGAALAIRAKLATLSRGNIAAELSHLTWDCPPGSRVQRVDLLGPEIGNGFPKPASDTERMFIVSPFLDAKTVRAGAKWGGPKTRRTLVSTSMELSRLLHEDEKVFEGFNQLLIQPIPDLPAELADNLDDEAPVTVESSESEEIPPVGLHAKLFFAAKGARRQLWLGSANATVRGWERGNFEVIAEMSIARDAADAIEGFIAGCEKFTHIASPVDTDEAEAAIELARKLLCCHWHLQQQIHEDEIEVIASSPPPCTDHAVQIEVAVLGGSWRAWPSGATSVQISGQRPWQRSDFLQIRLTCENRMCSWLQLAPCDKPPDEERDRALIARYLDPRMFLMWLRSLLADEPAHAAGGDWDAETSSGPSDSTVHEDDSEFGPMPTIEEVLRAWARDSSSFTSADDKVKAYLSELMSRASEYGSTADMELLQMFDQTWSMLASELRK